VAALVASVILRNNQEAIVLPFEQDVVNIRLNSRDSVMTNAQKLASIGGGGTCVSAPLQKLNMARVNVDLVIFISDNESWVDTKRNQIYNSGTATMKEWNEIKSRNERAKMICIDIVPGYHTQAPDEKNNILNVGGFSDQVFNVIDSFVKGKENAWVDRIKEVKVG